jgi:hypothetical protein
MTYILPSKKAESTFEFLRGAFCCDVPDINVGNIPA